MFCKKGALENFVKLLPNKHSSRWRRLEEVLKTSFVFVFERHLDEDEYILINDTSSENVFKTSWSRPIYSSCPYVFKTFLRYVFKTSSRRLAKTSSRHLQGVLPRRLQDVFKTSSKRLANTSWRHLQDVFKTYHQVKLFLLTSLWEIFNMFLRRTAKTVVYKDSPRLHF